MPQPRDSAVGSVALLCKRRAVGYTKATSLTPLCGPAGMQGMQKACDTHSGAQLLKLIAYGVTLPSALSSEQSQH